MIESSATARAIKLDRELCTVAAATMVSQFVTFAPTVRMVRVLSPQNIVPPQYGHSGKQLRVASTPSFWLGASALGVAGQQHSRP